jgi:hypothetical protein
VYGGVVLLSVVLVFVGGVRLGSRLAFRIVKGSIDRDSSHLSCLLGSVILFLSFFVSVVVATALMIAAIALPVWFQRP